MATLEHLLRHSPSNSNSKPALTIADGASISYPQLIHNIEQVRDTIVHSGGVQRGDIIAIILPNSASSITTFLAVTWARAIAAPLNAAYTTDEFLFYLDDIKAKAILLPPGDHAALAAAKKLNIPVWEVQEKDAITTISIPSATSSSSSSSSQSPEEEDVALFLHTSGTTSRPKGVPLTHKNLTISSNNVVSTYQLSSSDTTLLVMPLFHVHGLLGASLSTLTSGGTVVITPRFSASSFWPHVKKYGVTWYSAVPTIHQVLLIRADDIPSDHSLRFIRSCSSALSPDILAALEKKTNTPVLEAYGMTEASHQMASNPLPSVGPHKPGTVGKGTNVSIVLLDEQGKEKATGETGEVCIKGENVTHGYHNNPNANRDNFTADGWFRTGDQGILDKDGYLTITGRIKELINRGGEKIAPLEIDNALLAHPDISEAICFAVPDPKYGEEVQAAVVAKEGKKITEEEVIKFVQGRLAAFKVPKKIYITDALPRTATGKLQRKNIAAHFLGEKK